MKKKKKKKEEAHLRISVRKYLVASIQNVF